MKTTGKRLLSVLLVLSMLLIWIPTGILADDAAVSGTCGDALEWVLDDSGTLTISGTGLMNDYNGDAPWQSSADAITKIILSDGVETIGSGAFYACTALTEVDIPATVTAVGSYAFEGCTALETVSYAGSAEQWANIIIAEDGNAALTAAAVVLQCAEAEEPAAEEPAAEEPAAEEPAVEDLAAEDNEAEEAAAAEVTADNSNSCGTGLTWTLSSSGVLTISGSGAMDDYENAGAPWYTSCASVKQVVLDDGVTSIGTFAFEDCSSLTSVAIPDSVTTIGNCAFQNCTSLQTVTVPNTVTLLGNVETIETISYNNSGTNIGVFSGCTSLKSVTLGVSLKTLASQTFTSCDALESVTFYGKTTELEDQSVGYTSSGSVNSKLIISCYDGSNALEYAKTNGIKYTVLSDAVSVASGTCGDSIEWVLDSDGLLIISGSGKMDDYDSEAAPWYSIRSFIKQVTVESGVTRIGAFAFADCTNLQMADIPEGVRSIGGYAFKNCTSLQSITLPNTVSMLSTIESQSYNNSGTNSGVFSGCTNLKTVTLGAALETLDTGAFANCNAMESVTVYGAETQLAAKSVGYYSSGKVNGNLTIYGYDASTSQTYANANGITFSSMGAIQGFTVVSGQCGDNLTYTLDNLGVLTISGTGAMWDYTTSNSPFLEGQILVDGEPVGTIQKLVVEDGVTKIGENAFLSCSELETVTLPASVSSIGADAFTDCESLTDIDYAGSENTWRDMEKDAGLTAETEVHPATGHDWEDTYTTDVQETCTTAGSKSIHCSYCDATKDSTVIPADGHNYVETVVDPTTTAKGYTLHKCSRCGDCYTTDETTVLKANGWNEIRGNWYYYVSGTAITGWKAISRKWYYFNASGVMQTGWQNIDEKWYYFSEDATTQGIMLTGWQTISDTKYYFNTSGVMQTGVVYISRKYYLFDASGAMQTGWTQYNGSWYYLNTTTGVMLTGWQTLDQKKYYFMTSGTSVGIMQTGWQTISKKVYYFVESGSNAGAMLTGMQTIDGRQYYLGTTGARLTGWQTIKDQDSGLSSKYYFSPKADATNNIVIGEMRTSWLQIGSKWYYLTPDGDTAGVMQTGWQTIGGSKYYFNASGVMLKGWQTIKTGTVSNRYYLGTDGVMVTGRQKIGTKYYYFNEDGILQKNKWQKIDGKWYYFGSAGTMLTGWQTIKDQESGVSSKYYFSPTADTSKDIEVGEMRTGWLSIGTKWYYLSEETATAGAMLKGWQTIGGRQYYFSAYGVMATGWQTISKNKYYFSPAGNTEKNILQGEMLTGWQSISNKWYYFSKETATAGIMLKGLQPIDGKQYYFNTSGVMLTGSVKISGVWHTFGSDGAMIS